MFDIGFFEFVALAVIALLVFGPDRLPKVTAQATHWLRQIREQAQSARQQLTDSIDIDQSMLKDITDLHPRNIARNVMEPIDEAKAIGSDAISGVNGAVPPKQVAPPTPQSPSAGGSAVSFDPDAT
jgi:sec-independent protein translocase protein TatB